MMSMSLVTKLFITFLNIAKGPSTLHVIHSFDWCLQVEGVTTNGDTEEIEEAMEALEIIPVAPTEIPSPHPPSCRKKDLYVDPSQFNDIDEQTIKVDKSLLKCFCIKLFIINFYRTSSII